MAYREVVRALHASGAERLTSAAGQVAELLGQSSAARLNDARRLAADPVVQERLARPPESGDDVPPVVKAFVSRNPVASLWIYDRTGRAPGLIGHGAQARVATHAPPTAPVLGVGPLRLHDGNLSYSATVPIGADSAPAGFLSIQRSLGSQQAVGLIERLIGPTAVLKLGNAIGDVWTDLSVPVAAPPLASPGRTATYRTPTGSSRVGVTAAIPGTPWLVWVEVSEHTIVGPAATLLRQMVPIALALTALGALAVYAVSGQITKPLEQVAESAEAIANGDYTRRVDIARRDEIGRLGLAFNVMAHRVAEAHETLETRVTARTEELEQAREELDRFFSLSLDLLCIAGIDGKFRRVNPAWEVTLGWTARDLTVIPYVDLVHPDDRAATLREAAKLADGGATLSFENRYRTKDGSYRWLSWKSASLPDRGLIYAAAHDVTEQKRTERALHQHAADLATANSELESFSYSVSHDLRSPLRSIDGFAQALVEDYEDRLDETGRDYLGRIRAAAQRMGMLIDDLLSLSRVSRAELSRTAVDLTALAHDTAARLREQDPRRRVEWRIQSGMVADGDSRLLRIALDNLLGNAWKFTGQRETATIEFGTIVLPDGGRAFSVRDNGAGFDMSHAQKLFGAFQRLHGVTEFAGTGIGLATVQRIVRRHSGRIWAEAAVGQGATFFFTLEAS
jgi:PAS domain S-box-containing protein